MLISHYLQPCLSNEIFHDQFAFRPTGSTSAALACLLHKVTNYLETNGYVRCVMIDVSKAFDVVDRMLLLQKLQQLDAPPIVLKWIASFLSNRTQHTVLNAKSSAALPVNLGVVQGSALGPSLFSFFISDLQPISANNDMVKFADDVTVIAPADTDTDIAIEFDSVKQWAVNNLMTINFSKTKELVFRRPRPSAALSPPCIEGIERIVIAKLLGVFIDSQFHFTEHIDFILRQCSQRMYIIRSLQRRGLPESSLEAVFNAIVLSRIIYALSAWGGFVSAHDRSRVNKLLFRAKSYKYCKKLSSFDALLEKADRGLFRKSQNTDHCLHCILPSVRVNIAMLRDRGHPFSLPICKYELFKKSFVIRSLFKFI
jgi:hypothetical protein